MYQQYQAPQPVEMRTDGVQAEPASALAGADLAETAQTVQQTVGAQYQGTQPTATIVPLHGATQDAHESAQSTQKYV